MNAMLDAFTCCRGVVLLCVLASIIACGGPDEHHGSSAGEALTLRYETRLSIVSGDGQTSAAGTALAKRLVVRAVRCLTPRICITASPGVRILWNATAGGSVSARTTTTNFLGYASVTARLGITPGTNTFTATVGSVGSPVVFTEKGTAPVASHFMHTVAVKTDGTLWAWGVNESGQLGVGTTTVCTGEPCSASPVLVGNGFASVAAGLEHTVAVKTDGTLWAWGDNAAGQLGVGTTTICSYQGCSTSPVQVGSGFASVAAGDYYTVAVKTDGTLWGWGSNYLGQLGDGTTTPRPSPVQVGSGFASVAAGRQHTVAMKTDGTLWAWGDNAAGQLGVGTTTICSYQGPCSTSPVQVGSGFADYAAGGGHTVAVKTDGTLWAWGGNGYGQLGDGTTTPRPSPVQVGSGFASVAAGSDHTVAVKTDGTLWAWGNNQHGELGDGTTTERHSPVRISY
jgi:alpha-tubulin suppressor-like RCC1 family protein